MKDIDKMNVAELADALQRFEFDMLNEAIANRLRVIHEETRWIPVSERMPTIDDTYRMKVLWIDDQGFIIQARYDQEHDMLTWVAWQRITPPEANP
jgi:hypothetical protein